MNKTEDYHIPVLLEPSINGLNIQSNKLYVDVTFGGGGHSKLISDKLNGSGHLYVFDQDADAQKNAWKASNFTFIPSNFKYMTNHLHALGVKKVDGILADLGVSSHQFNEFERGFSFRSDSFLDMRMNQHASLSASEVVNQYEEKDLVRVFREFGELKNAYKVASRIVLKREEGKIDSTHKLMNAIQDMAPAKKRNQFLAQVFQAIRIEVNQELEVLKSFLLQCEKLLNVDGRLVVISYHSLEDRLVKNFLKKGDFSGMEQKNLFGHSQKPFDEINRKVIIPDEVELKRNSRSRSAKLRIGKRNDQ